jgi:hypothetical protein
MLFPVDIPACTVLFAIQLRAFLGGYNTIRFRLGFVNGDPSLLCLKPRGFAFRQLTALDALLDPLLLVVLPLCDFRCCGLCK